MGRSLTTGINSVMTQYTIPGYADVIKRRAGETDGVMAYIAFKRGLNMSNAFSSRNNSVMAACA